jgi:hypothetical protein
MYSEYVGMEIVPIGLSLIRRFYVTSDIIFASNMGCSEDIRQPAVRRRYSEQHYVNFHMSKRFRSYIYD